MRLPMTTVRCVATVLVAGLAPVCMAHAVVAAELDADSKIVAVTIYPRGAEVSRTASVELPAGETTLVLDDLPDGMTPNSLRIEGEAAGNITIGTVNTEKRTLTTEESRTASEEREDLRRKLEANQRARAKLDYDIKVKETQRDYLTNLAGLPARGGPAPLSGGAQAPSVDWAGMFELIGTNMAAVQDDLFRLSQRRDRLDRRRRDIEAELARLSPATKRVTVGSVLLTADAATTANLRISYQVREAGWKPLYDARLSTTGDEPALTLVRRASIGQRTGEDWRDVRMSLSTARPSARTAAPELSPMTVDIAPEAKPETRQTATVGRRSTGSGLLGAYNMGRQPAADAKRRVKAPRAAAVQQAKIEAGTFNATYTIPSTVTLTAATKTKNVRIDTIDIAPELKVRTVARLDPTAYLYAKFDLPGATPVLPGQVSLFRDATYLGTGQVPLIAAGDSHELGFGADDKVKVTFAVADETRGESGIISSSRTDARAYKIALENLHDRTITFEVIDQIPVPLNEDITVKRNGAKPSREGVDDKRGVVAWDGTLKAGAKTNIAFGYQIAWPAEKKVKYGRGR